MKATLLGYLHPKIQADRLLRQFVLSRLGKQIAKHGNWKEFDFVTGSMWMYQYCQSLLFHWIVRADAFVSVVFPWWWHEQSRETKRREKKADY